MIDAPGLRCGAEACMVKNTAVRLVRMISSNEASDVCRQAWRGDSGIGKHDIKLAEFRHEFRNSAFGRPDVRDVCLNRQHVMPRYAAGLTAFRASLIGWPPVIGNGRPCANHGGAIHRRSWNAVSQADILA